MFYTYILQSKKDGDLYIGSTKNLRKRFEQHQKGEVFSTKSRRPLILIYYEACIKEDDARRREKSLKTFRGKITLRRRLKSFFTGSSHHYPQLKIAAARAVVLILITAFALTSVFSALPFPKEARAAPTISKSLTRPINEIGLVGWWTMDGPDMLTNVADKSGQGNNGSLIHGGSGTTTAPGKVGQALNFDGVNDYVNTTNSTSLQITGAMTISTWFKGKSSNANGSGVSKLGDSGARGYQLGPDNAGTVFAFIASDATTLFSTSATGHNATLWTHYTMVYIPSVSLTLYRNGVQVAQNTTSVPASQYSASNNFAIGNRWGGGASDAFFLGLIDDVRIYSRALSAADVLRLYQIGATSKIAKTLPGRDSLTSGLVGWWTMDGPDMLTNVADKSGQGNTGNLVHGGSGTTTAPGKIGQALSFDGTNDSVSVPINLSGTNVVSVAMWIYRSSYLGTDAVQTEYTSNFSSYNGAFVFDTDYNTECPSSGQIAWGTHTTAGYNIKCYTRPSVGAWHHYVLIADMGASSANELSLYIDGALQTSTSQPYTVDQTVNFVNSTLYFMSRAGSSIFSPGQLDDVRIYNRALSASEITQLYNMGR